MTEQSSQIVPMIKKVLPAVVSITSSKEFGGFESSFGSIRGDPFDTLLFSRPGRKKVNIGGGTGFIVDESGLLLTNRHVVEDPSADYRVILQNGESLKPEVLVKDPINDVAVLRIDTSEGGKKLKTALPTIMLGNSSYLELGQAVVAIGNALGLFRNTVSTGVISGLSREITAESNLTQETQKLRGLIQTDAAINPGNSGGPLVNVEGRVVGINAAMVFGAENIGFALPINNAKKDLEELKHYGRVRQPFLGLRYIPLSQELKARFNLPVDCGALVVAEPDVVGFRNAVVPNSPADKAGIRERDIILEMGDKKITQEQTINDILQEFQVGQRLPLKILRGGKEKILKISLSEKT